MKILALVLIGLSSAAVATEQSAEILLHNGEKMYSDTFPLEAYFQAKPPRPEWLTESNTACWRGYIGTWEVVGGELFLKTLSREEWPDPSKDTVTIDITRRVFPGAKPPIKADWFSGNLVVPQGKVIRTEGFFSIHERNLVLTFKEGVLTGSRTVDNRTKPRAFTKKKAP